ncbi:MAG TPA: crosslink repair DNA glycosylase YcaQ family protein [Solirubrobacteraceae bacterium]|nr:crosslink repair DNA glycosylase YcaQ family protein [Solirubrobacteraceae bacterium]
MVGVYSSHPSAPLSLYARAKDFDFASVDGLRLPAMRGSIHLLPRDTAHLPFRALKVPRSVEESRMRYFKLTPERYEELRAKVLDVADEPRTSAELKKLVGGGDELRYVLGATAREGLLVRVGAEGLRSNALKWVRPKPKIKPAKADEALAWLAGEYLRAYGPIRREDFAWWSGAERRQADAALAEHDTVELDGGLLLRREDREAFERATKPSGIDLLPKWDMLTMGYRKDGRARFAHDDVVDRCYDFRGDGNPLVLRDGQAVAAWSMKFAGKRMEVGVDWFDKPGRREAKATADAFEDLAKLLGATSVKGNE